LIGISAIDFSLNADALLLMTRNWRECDNLLANITLGAIFRTDLRGSNLDGSHVRLVKFMINTTIKRIKKISLIFRELIISNYAVFIDDEISSGNIAWEKLAMEDDAAMKLNEIKRLTIVEQDERISLITCNLNDILIYMGISGYLLSNYLL